MRLAWKQFSPLLLMVVVGLLATGCSSSNKTSTSTKKTQVRIWRVDQEIDSFRGAIKAFEKANSKTTVTYLRKTIDNYELSALRSMAARSGPDIWSIPNDWLGDEENLIIPLPDNFFFVANAKCPATGDATNKSCLLPKDAVKTLFAPGIADTITRLDGKVYGMPTNVDTLQLYVNSDLLSTASAEFKKSMGKDYKDEVYKPVQTLLSKPPATWNDLLEQTKYVTKREGSALTRSTIALGTADNLPNAQDILQLLILQNGAKVVSADHKNALFHIPETTPSGGRVRPGEKALDFYTSFADATKQNYSWNPSMPPALDAFAQGKVAMVIAYSDFGNKLKVKYPKFRFSKAAVPQISLAQPAVNLITFSVETVTQTADNSGQAFAFLKSYTGQENAAALAKQLKLKSPYLKNLNNPESDYITKQVVTGETIFKKSRAQFDETFRKMIIDVTQSGIPVDQALDAGADTINELLTPTPTT